LKTGRTDVSGEDAPGAPSALPDALYGGPEATPDDVEEALGNIISSAQLACPTFSVPTDVFLAYLRERLPADVPRWLALRQMHTSDLYLACGCALGEVGALAAFEDHCMRQLDRVLAKMRIAPEVGADLKQDIRIRILVGIGGRPEIVGFSGRGDLRGWVRVMAVRQALQHQCRARREVPVTDDELLQSAVVSGTSELDDAKQKYRKEFKRAFETALRALPDRERTLLRQHHVDGLSIDEIGALYRVHRSTAARLLTRVRVRLLETTRLHMMSELDMAPDDLDSIIRMIRSQIEISLRGLRRRGRR
jgi:RNA polymerase sigma-70 factor (ECF subfamily)